MAETLTETDLALIFGEITSDKYREIIQAETDSETRELSQDEKDLLSIPIDECIGDLTEGLIPVNSESIALLEKNMDDDTGLKQRIAVKKIYKDPYYRCLVEEIAPILTDVTLFDIVKIAEKIRDILGLELYFCRRKNKITAFFAFRQIIADGDLNAIYNLRIFSFFDLKKLNITLVPDLIWFLDEMLKNHRFIEWTAEKNNPAAILYNKVYRMFDFEFSEDKKMYEDGNSYVYPLKKEN
jgi:hypothetical protein